MLNICDLFFEHFKASRPEGPLRKALDDCAVIWDPPVPEQEARGDRQD
jgi:hypothetical protein